MAEWRLLPVVAEVVVQGRLAERLLLLVLTTYVRVHWHSAIQQLVDRCPGHGLLPEWRRLHQLVDECPGHGLLPEWRRLQLLVDRCPGHGLMPEWRRL
jgi:hypothetical protein